MSQRSCNNCGKVFDPSFSAPCRQVHYESCKISTPHLQELPNGFKCKICSKEYPTQRGAFCHIRGHLGTTQKTKRGSRIDRCPTCKRDFITEFNSKAREAHVESCKLFNPHLEKVKNQWKCKMCGEMYARQMGAFFHMRKHFKHVVNRKKKGTKTSKTSNTRTNKKIHKNDTHVSKSKDEEFDADNACDQNCKVPNRNELKQSKVVLVRLPEPLVQLYQTDQNQSETKACRHCDKTFSTRRICEMHENLVHGKTKAATDIKFEDSLDLKIEKTESQNVNCPFCEEEEGFESELARKNHILSFHRISTEHLHRFQLTFQK